MPFCPRCGSSTDDDMAFCPYCGHCLNIRNDTVVSGTSSSRIVQAIAFVAGIVLGTVIGVVFHSVFLFIPLFLGHALSQKKGRSALTFFLIGAMFGTAISLFIRRYVSFTL